MSMRWAMANANGHGGDPFSNPYGYDGNNSDDQDDDFLEDVNGDDMVALSQMDQLQSVSNTFNKGETFKDVVHKEMKIRGAAARFVDTAEFQRLRHLKQLGCSDYVFHCATHTRFEHSLGVAFKAGQVALRLYLIGKQCKEEWACGPGSRQQTASDLKCIEIAGLCHDLGHGPYSHMFDSVFLPQVVPKSVLAEWTHEKMGGNMLEHMVETGGGLEAFGIDQKELTFIKELITCDSDTLANKGSMGERKFLYDIVANKRNGIDVDKWDYLARDAHYCDMKGGNIDLDKLTGMIKVIDGQICYKFGDWEYLQQMFQARAMMHRNVYTHEKVKAIEYMVADAMVEANNELKIAEAIHSPAKYLQLDDGILRDIEKSNTQGLARARHLVERIRKRDLYLEVDGVFVGHSFKTPSVQDIVSSTDWTGQRALTAEDLIIHDRKIDFGMKGENPLEHTRFFKDWRDTSSKFKKAKDMTTMLPSEFRERKLRLFVKDQKMLEQAEAAWAAWTRKERIAESDPPSCKRSRAAAFSSASRYED